MSELRVEGACGWAQIGGRLKMLVALGALIALALAVSAAPAMATTTPATGFTQFTGCPNPSQNPAIATCFREVITGGELQMGNIQIPISNPITFSGGETAGGAFDYNSFGGIPKVAEEVPGGVVGLTGFTWLEEILSPSALTLYAVIELVGTPGDQLTEPATLSFKVHFINSVLGSKCYAGTNASPIKLNLITGTTSPPAPNVPITGMPGEPESTTGIEHLRNGTYVDNSFSVPGANGCQLTLFEFIPISINAPINEQSALPSPAGYNRTIQDFDTETASAPVWVYP